MLHARRSARSECGCARRPRGGVTAVTSRVHCVVSVVSVLWSKRVCGSDGSRQPTSLARPTCDMAAHARHTARETVGSLCPRAYTPHTTRTLCVLSSWIKMHQRSWQPIPGTHSAAQMLTAIAPSSTNTPTPAKTARNGFLLGPKPARQCKAVCRHAEAPLLPVPPTAPFATTGPRPPPASPAHRPRHHRRCGGPTHSAEQPRGLRWLGRRGMAVTAHWTHADASDSGPRPGHGTR